MGMFSSMMIGLIGFAYAYYGHKNKQPFALVGGVAMWATPYFIGAIWLKWIVVVLIGVGVYFGSKLLR